MYLCSYMNITFYKYQGTGNDFIIIDNRSEIFPKQDTKFINTLCHRNFGIGADGLILLENDVDADFKMVYFNADGNESTMCGNGGRCIVAFAYKLGLLNTTTTFNAIDGLHNASIKDGIVSLQMIDVHEINFHDGYMFTDTGSPHHVEIVDNLDKFDVVTEGREIRNTIYGSEGSNVNFVEKVNDQFFKLRTYERGVENETLACGTGATAAAIAMHASKHTQNNEIDLQVEGGRLKVSFHYNDTSYTSVFLKGPATFVFEGIITL